MGIVGLAIGKPENGQRFVGSTEAGDVKLRGNVPPTGHGTLFYRWYSSLDGKLNEPASADARDTRGSLSVGSHVITFTAKDAPGDTEADIQAVREAGMAGGPPTPGVEHPCVVHVFVAAIVEPAGGALSKANATLTALAPKKWGRKKGSSDAYEPDPEYHGDPDKGKVGVNRIRYRWRFRPQGPPEDRAAADLVPTINQLTLLPNPADEKNSMAVRYSGALPAGLGVGKYTLALRVEELVEGQDGPTFGDETPPREVVLS